VCYFHQTSHYYVDGQGQAHDGQSAEDDDIVSCLADSLKDKPAQPPAPINAATAVLPTA